MFLKLKFNLTIYSLLFIYSFQSWVSFSPSRFNPSLPPRSREQSDYFPFGLFDRRQIGGARIGFLFSVAESAQSGKASSRFMSANHSVVVVDISSDEEGEEQVLGLGWWREEESDEVVVLDELSAPSVKRPKQSGGLVDDDDDCLVLESDPDKPVLVESDQGRGGDDLLIVAEKGQVSTAEVHVVFG